MKKSRKKLKKILTVFLLVFFSSVTAFYLFLLAAFHADLKKDYAAQEVWMRSLSESPRAPVNEQSFADFDLAVNEYKLNEVQFVATHNSFKALPNPYIMGFLKLLSPDGVKKGEYGLPKLYNQLDSGIRGVEIDIARYGDKLITVHNAKNDWRTNTTDFRLALQEIKLWSDNNPGHFPLNVMVQVRNQWSLWSTKFNKFDSASIADLNALFAEVFGDRLLRPADVKGAAPTLRDAVTTAGWPLLSDCMGKVYVMLLIEEQENEDYFVNLDPAFAAQNAFVITNVDMRDVRDYTAIILADNPEGRHLRYTQAGYLVRTRIDLQYQHTEERHRATVALGSNILATDYPLNNSYGDGYVCWAGEEGITIIAKGT